MTQNNQFDKLEDDIYQKVKDQNIVFNNNTWYPDLYVSFHVFPIVMESILSMHLLQVMQVMEEFILFIMINLGMLLKIKHFEKVIF